ncbi:chloride channel [Hyaloraphidium curvatum]|nr:chloride channel [Hyaloraphidium curvatum]
MDDDDPWGVPSSPARRPGASLLPELDTEANGAASDASPSDQKTLARDRAFSSAAPEPRSAEDVRLFPQNYGDGRMEPASPRSPDSGRRNTLLSENEVAHLLSAEQAPPSVPGIYRGSRNPDPDNYDPHSVEWSQESTGRRVAYENFTTIDWIHDFAKERVRIRKLRSRDGLGAALVRLWDGAQAWIVVCLVGVTAGFVAAWIDIVSEWLSDLKEGFCTEGFYLNRHFCCWHSTPEEVCRDWRPWGEAFGAVSSTAVWWADYFMYVLFACLFAVVAALLVKVYAPYAAGSGIAEVKTILSGFVIRKFLGGWTLLIKCIGLALSTASGLSLGKEGPLVHVGCCIGNIIARMFPKYNRNEAKKREILSAAAAAGVSVAFGSPIGGVLFSLEEVSYYFPMKTLWRSFLCAMVAAISLQLMNPFRSGKLVLFQVTYKRDWHTFELPFFVLLGAIGGLFGAFFIRMNLKVVAFRKTTWLKNYQVQEVFVVSLVTAAIGFSILFLKVNMGALLGNLFRECEEIEEEFMWLCQRDRFVPVVVLLLVSFVVRIFLTVFTFGIRVPAGIFVPSMAIGACAGRALGIMIQMWQEANPGFWLFSACKPDTQCVTPGTYAMVGAAAALAGITRMTVALTVIMFELTGALTYVLPIMITVMVSKWTGDAFGKQSIYDGLINLNGYPYLDNKNEYFHSTLISQVMTTTRDLEIITATGHTVDTLDELLQSTDFKGFPVVNSATEMMLIGYAGRAELRYALDQARKRSDVTGETPCYFTEEPPPSHDSAEPYCDLRPWTDLTPFTCGPRFPMELVMELFRKMGLKYIVVTKTGVLQGLLTKKDLLRHLAVTSSPDLSLDPLLRLGEAADLERRLGGQAGWVRAPG